MSDFKQTPGTGDVTAVMDRAYEDRGTAPAEDVEAVTVATPANVVSVLSETRFPFQKGENSPSETRNWNKAGKKASGPSRLPTKEKLEKLAALITEARGRGVSDKEMARFLRGLGFEAGRTYWSGTEVNGHELYAYCWLAGNTDKPDVNYNTPLKQVLKTTSHYAQYIKSVGV